MSDIFREVEEDLRREQFERLWKRYGGLIIAIAVAIVVAVAGYRGWQWYQARQAAAAGEQYFAALNAAQSGDNATNSFATIASEGGAYSNLARLRAAADRAASGDTAGALAAYEAIANENGIDRNLRHVAALRAAYLAIDTDDQAAMESRLQPLLGAGSAFRHGAREVMALTALKSGDVTATAKWADEALADTDVPSGMRQRLELILSVIASERAAVASS